MQRRERTHSIEGRSPAATHKDMVHSQSFIDKVNQIKKQTLAKIKQRNEAKKEEEKRRNFSVHVYKIDDLPKPLTRDEIALICKAPELQSQFGSRKPSGRRNLSHELFEKARLRHEKKSDNQINDLHSAYETIFNLFTDWHKELIKSRHIGPAKVKEKTDKR